MKYLLLSIFLLIAASKAFTQDTKSFTDKTHISLETTLGSDLFYRGHLGGLVKYNMWKNLAVGTQTNISRSYRSMGEVVSISSDDFRSINFTYTQRFGVGAVIGKERFNHTFLLMTGPKYYRLNETHNYPQFEESTVKVSTWIPDAGFLYSLKIGKQKTYFTTQVYIPFLLIPDNLMGVTLSFGVGIQ